MATMTFESFFKAATGHAPFPYQMRMASDVWPEVVEVPTGLGKTAAVVAAWLWRQLNEPGSTSKRLMYMLPMRTLVRQTEEVAASIVDATSAMFQQRGLDVPSVHVMMGGEADDAWMHAPEKPALIIGTQDLLLSGALNRGYAVSRFRWPIVFGLLNNDAWWVLDEMQLMGVGVETSAQLAGLRSKLGTLAPTGTTWMSATLELDRVRTVDHPFDPATSVTVRLDGSDRQHPVVQRRTSAQKSLQRLNVQLDATSAAAVKAYGTAVAAAVVDAHKAGTLTLVVVNRIDRAQAVFAALRKMLPDQPLGLVHSRFRPVDREKHEAVLFAGGDRIVVATQAIEAGVDVSAATLFTELAPWASLVQRIGRCNRYGEYEDANVHWIDLDLGSSGGKTCLPYEADDLTRARDALALLDRVGLDALADVCVVPKAVVRPVLRRKDLLDLFDTTTDLTGNDLDVSRYVRDTSDTDVQFYWRPLAGPPSSELAAPTPQEICRASIGDAQAVLDAILKQRKALRSRGDRALAEGPAAWRWDELDGEWIEATRVRPGSTILLASVVGCYSPILGWLGDLKQPAVPSVSGLRDADGRALQPARHGDDIGSDVASQTRHWQALTGHLGDVHREAMALATSLQLEPELAAAVCRAAEWHDVGKAHPVFQAMLGTGPTQAAPVFWAKSAQPSRRRSERPHFRHELASALAWLAHHDTTETVARSLVAYLIAAHHGKVRGTIRPLPGEVAPLARAGTPVRYARGVWDGDELPAVQLPSGETVGPFTLSVQVMELGRGSWLDQTVALRDDTTLGPFRLALLETLVRIADWRASASPITGIVEVVE